MTLTPEHEAIADQLCADIYDGMEPALKRAIITDAIARAVESLRQENADLSAIIQDMRQIVEEAPAQSEDAARKP